jgi:diaminohydroxyphosphoribosylaminopyrimidine deaminase/5-amino-6-(5-phosphoribosylamino)uracil reductase
MSTDAPAGGGFSAEDHRHMAHALRLAGRGLYTTDPNPRVGCVLVSAGEVVGEGWHARAGEPHAEIHALRAAGERAAGATAYVTLEPCVHHGRTPPCADALVAASVARVVVAMKDPNPLVDGGGLGRLATAGIRVEWGLLEDEARALNPGFVARMTRGRPHVRCKLAMSLDGRTAMASGESRWITGPAARRDVQRLRARSSAVVTGIGTLMADDPLLTVRPEEIGEPAPPGGWRQPLRVVLDPRLSTPPTARCLSAPGRTLIATCCQDDEAAEPLIDTPGEVIRFPGSVDGLDLKALVRYLAEEEAVNELLVETGATLSGAFVQAGLVDELILYVAPKLLGASARGLLHLSGLERMADAVPLEVTDVRAVGRDWRVTATPGHR